eukprot:CAMPEP_0113591682 /NCGR_PEP_ID=MMETSP0015_2-20120614/37405_1 /TAXON_ID=2838 /ORGANISM="Odontella" /LENGTH=57 /DNA_ID=CAMNT_0000498091 /DNA_START=88 /DNA_END=258 /DNA_ORIENTATION=+ /assembly_acc=CAM_ASM_000160
MVKSPLVVSLNEKDSLEIVLVWVVALIELLLNDVEIVRSSFPLAVDTLRSIVSNIHV